MELFKKLSQILDKLDLNFIYIIDDNIIKLNIFVKK